MKKLALIFCLLIGILACKKEEIKKENCNCGRILSDDITNYSIKVRNNCTGNEKTFTYDFKDFKYPPIVSATLVNTGQTPAGQNVSVILKPITETRVEGTVKFGTSGDLSLAVHLVLVGVPN